MKAHTLAAGAALSLLLLPASGQQYYQTKTPYQPQQDSASYEAVPPGFQPVFVQMLARHGSRGLSSFKTDGALYALWQQADQENALTPLGHALGPDLLQMIRANALLGYGVEGISKPGYGNETMQGLEEHTGMAQRLLARLPTLFQDAAAQQRRIIVDTSGKDRAVDSGEVFSRTLVAQQPALKPLLVAGTDRYLLYFHKLPAPTEQTPAAQRPTYDASQAYQRWVKSEALQNRSAAIYAQPQIHAAAQAVLARLFTPAFIAALDAGKRNAVNSASYTFSSADGKFTTTLKGDDNSSIDSSTEAAMALYDLYAAAADMHAELTADFTRYVPPEQARVFAEAEDAVAFYEKGPGSAGNGDLNWRMANALLADFFREADAIAAGDHSHAAKLRFAHAEIVIPLAAALGLPGMSKQTAPGSTYSYKNNSWRGATVAPMAANLQWEMYQNAAGEFLVRLLYNERETDFSAACASARWQRNSHFYNYSQLKHCYTKTIVKMVE